MTQEPKAMTLYDQMGGAAMRAQLMQVLPKSVNLDRFVAMAVATAKLAVKNGPLAPESILICMYESAKLGLELNSQMGLGYIVPFYNKKLKKNIATFIPGYRGLIQLMRNAGTKDIHGTIVYSGDEWDYYEDEGGRHISHRPTMEKDRGDPVCGYSVAVLPDGTRSVHVEPYHKIAAIRKQALVKTQNTGPWITHEEEMARKTVIRHHAKTLPQSAESAAAIGLDEQLEIGSPLMLVPDELVGAGIIDAEYQEQIEQAIQEPANTSSKPDLTPATPKQTKGRGKGRGKGKQVPETPTPTPSTATGAEPPQPKSPGRDPIPPLTFKEHLEALRVDLGWTKEVLTAQLSKQWGVDLQAGIPEHKQTMILNWMADMHADSIRNF